MNITNADSFNLGSYNTIFLTGATGTGKSVLQDKLIERVVKENTPESLQFVVLDMTGVDFDELNTKYKSFVKKYLKFDSEEGLSTLEKMAAISEKRVDSSSTKPMVFICIEECDMAVLDQARFDAALMKLNKNAKAANIKLIFSTSRPAPDVISKQLLDSFDVILAGELASDADHEYLNIPKSKDVKRYSFTVVDNHHSENMSSEKAQNQEIIFLKDTEWKHIDGELCRISEFLPMGSSVSNGEVVAPIRTMPYASISFDCTKISSEADITGFVTHKLDFANLWKAFNEHGIAEGEEVLFYWTTKHYANKVSRLLSLSMPKMVVMVCPKGTYDSVKRHGMTWPPKDEVMVLVYGLMATEYYIPDVIK